jgi:hypothetical protein
MGKRCMDIECPYLADDGTCLLPQYDLKKKCWANERLEYEETNYGLCEDYVTERLKSLGILQ